MSKKGASGRASQNSPGSIGTQREDIAPEYDFSQGVRGKHARPMRDGYTMVIHHSDGTTEVRDVTSRPGTVVLDPDVRAYFPDSEAVNRALRRLISQESLPPTSDDVSQEK